MKKKPDIFYPTKVGNIENIDIEKVLEVLAIVYKTFLEKHSHKELFRTRWDIEVTGSLSLLQYMPSFRDKFEVNDIDVIFPFYICSSIEEEKEFEKLINFHIVHVLKIPSKIQVYNNTVFIDDNKLLEYSFRTNQKKLLEDQYLETFCRTSFNSNSYMTSNMITIQFSVYETIFFKKLQYLFQMYNNSFEYGSEKSYEHFNKIKKDFQILFDNLCGEIEIKLKEKKQEENKVDPF